MRRANFPNRLHEPAGQMILASPVVAGGLTLRYEAIPSPMNALPKATGISHSNSLPKNFRRPFLASLLYHIVRPTLAPTISCRTDVLL